jgi:DNA-binding MarR family transcriptional regulator
VVRRIQRLQTYLDAALEATLAEFGLTGPIFHVLSVLRRQGPPFRISQRSLMDRLHLTSGTVSVRVDQVVQRGLALRAPDPADRRGALVTLTERGLAVCDACAPAYLAAEDRLLSALSRAEQAALGDLLRKLLVSFESEIRTQSDGVSKRLGLTLAPAHVTRQMQRALGVPERAGLLVRWVAPDGPAARAGLREGDVLVRAGTLELRSAVVLAQAVHGALTKGELTLRVLRGLDERRLSLRLA